MENAVNDIFWELVTLFGADNVELIDDFLGTPCPPVFFVEAKVVALLKETEMELFKSIVSKAELVHICEGFDGKVRLVIGA